MRELDLGGAEEWLDRDDRREDIWSWAAGARIAGVGARRGLAKGV